MINIEEKGNYKHPENNEDNIGPEEGGAAAFLIILGIILYFLL